ERENLALQDEKASLIQAFNALSQRHEKLKIELEGVKTALKMVEDERNYSKKENDSKKDQIIERLQTELHEVHKISIKQISALGQRADEALIAEKVKVINLEEKNNKLAREIKKINLELKVAQNAVNPIKTQLKKLRAFVQEAVSFEALQAYERRNIDQMLGINDE